MFMFLCMYMKHNNIIIESLCIFMCIMPNISVSGETSSYLADATKFPGNSYDDKGNGN